MLWKDAAWISFDTETSGKYPLDAEICEIAAVKWVGGKIVDEFESFIRVSRPMSDEVIAIHHITNEMLIDAPPMEKVIKDFAEFTHGACLVAHHAPFDLGFISIEFEKYKIPLPEQYVFCTSLLSRKLFSDSKNHKLQTLIEYFNLPKGSAHRALDDSKACLSVALKCLEKAGNDSKLDQIVALQGGPIEWKRFSISALRSQSRLKAVIESLELKQDVQIEYQGGSKPGSSRTVKPIGLVRSLNGDFLVAQDEPDQIPKRYFLDRISASRL